MDDRLRALDAAVAVVRSKLPETPRVAVTLGSGLSDALSLPNSGTIIPWSEIPGFPLPTVEGHAGDLWAGRIHDVPVLIQRGRTHFYEGRSLDDVVFATRLFALLGIETLLATNAAGGIDRAFRSGDLVLIADHINMLGANPLRGPNLDPLGPRFPDMSRVYSLRLRELAKQAAEEEGIELKEGVYLATMGPSYETPAEIRAFRALGADLVGMSTVPEAIVARHAGMEVLAVSMVTNLAAGVDPTATLEHAEVIETTKRKGAELGRLLTAVVGRL